MITYVYDLWERVFHEIGERDHPDVRPPCGALTPYAVPRATTGRGGGHGTPSFPQFSWVVSFVSA